MSIYTVNAHLGPSYTEYFINEDTHLSLCWLWSGFGTKIKALFISYNIKVVFNLGDCSSEDLIRIWLWPSRASKQSFHELHRTPCLDCPTYLSFMHFFWEWMQLNKQIGPAGEIHESPKSHLTPTICYGFRGSVTGCVTSQPPCVLASTSIE